MRSVSSVSPRNSPRLKDPIGRSAFTVSTFCSTCKSMESRSTPGSQPVHLAEGIDSHELPVRPFRVTAASEGAHTQRDGHRGDHPCGRCARGRVRVRDPEAVVLAAEPSPAGSVFKHPLK